MEFPERIYLFDCNPSLAIKLDGDTEYIRKDVVDNMLQVAEDHAYLAGQEAMREQMIEKAVEWLKAYIHYDDFGGNMEWLVPFENDECMIQHFKTYMEE